MGSLSPRLQVRVSQKQILTPGLVQMVSLLQLNRLELKDMISAEVAQNPVLEEATEGGEELTPEELQPLLEAEGERSGDPADQSILEVTAGPIEVDGIEAEFDPMARVVNSLDGAAPSVGADDAGTDQMLAGVVENLETKAADPFDEIDFGSYFDDYLDPGYKSPASEISEKPSFETFLSSPVTLTDHLHSQLALIALPENVRDAAEGIIGNLDENGYLTSTSEEIATAEGHEPAVMAEALNVVHSLDPAGVGAADLRECLLLQVESRNGKGGVAWQILSDHLKLVELKQFKELAKVLHRPPEHVETAVDVIRHLDPRPGLRYSGPGARQVEPDVYISKDGEDYLIQINDEDVPQLRLNPQYRRMLDRNQEPDKEVRNYVKERYASAIQLMKNIEQRKHTILKVCQSIVRRQMDFLEHGIDELKPMMIKEIAEEIGVHPSTVSRAVSSKYAHTPQGVFELRYFFSEAVQGPSGGGTPLLILKRRVKKMIEEEDTAHPLTDEHITERLQAEGIQVTRRTVAKYREDMRIPSTHQRRVRKSDGVSNMKVSYTGIKSGLPATLQKKLDAKFAKLSKKVDGRGEKQAHVVVTSERHLHKAEITLRVHNHHLVGIAFDSDVFKAMCAALERIDKQAAKEGAKWRRTTRRSEPMKVASAKGAEPVALKPAAVAGKNGQVRRVAASSDVRVFRPSEHERRKPITLEEALLQMEDGRDYVAYRDADKEVVCMLIRRRDGHYDLIET